MMCDLENDLSIELLMFRPYLVSLPTHDRIFEQRLYFQNSALQDHTRTQDYISIGWKLLKRLEIWDTSNLIWHSTYYSNLDYWKGPYVLTLYDMIYEKYPSQFPDSNTVIKRKKKAILRADVILSISNSTRNRLLDLYPISNDKIKVIYPGYNKIFAEQETKGNINKPFFLYVGNRAPYKGFIHLLEAFSKITEQQEVELIVVGELFNDQEESLIRELRIWDSINSMRHISDEKLCELYNLAVAFIYPSWEEGFGIPLVEAMACGCPIVASKIASTFEVASDIPIYFEVGSMDSFVDALSQAIQEGRDSPRTDHGLLRAALFSWERTAKETLDIYRSLI